MVPFDEPLLHTLDRFQQGNSHMAVVSRIPSRTESKDAPGSVNEEAKVGLTRRFLNRVGFGDDTSSSESSSDEDGSNASQKKGRRNRKKSNASNISRKKSNESSKPPKKREKDRTGHTTPPAPNWMHWARMDALEQTMPSDAVLPDANANEVSTSGFLPPRGHARTYGSLPCLYSFLPVSSVRLWALLL